MMRLVLSCDNCDACIKSVDYIDAFRLFDEAKRTGWSFRGGIRCPSCVLQKENAIAAPEPAAMTDWIVP
jgi:hypothetical protein